MRILLTRSMPFCTPNTTTATVAPAKIRKNTSGCQAFAENDAKYAAVSAPAPTSAESPTANAQMYFVTQPPMTQ